MSAGGGYVLKPGEVEQIRQEIDEARFPTPFLRALRDEFNRLAEQTEDLHWDEAGTWLSLRRSAARVFEAFVLRMARELATNSHKGDRPGWRRAGSREMVSEVLYHAAKLTYAVRQYEQGDGELEKVREFAADVGNCALMVADCCDAFEPAAPAPTEEERR